MSLLDIEKAYCRSIVKQVEELEKAYEKLISLGEIGLCDHEITEAILYRMRTYYEVHNRVKSLLDKRYAQPAADLFAEVVAFYLKLLLQVNNTGLAVASERTIKPKRGAIRPDISVFKDDEVLAMIECKTQSGWARDTWESDFNDRKRKLKAEFPGAQAFLVVLTTRNWPGFPKDNAKVGVEYYALTNVWPTEIPLDNVEQVIENPIETLFNRILDLVK